MAWKSQRSRALDLAMQQSEVTAQQAAAMRAEIVALHQELAALHRELARRDIELIDAMARVAQATDQVRIQNEQDRDRHDRIDRAIELLTLVVARSGDDHEIEAAEPSEPTATVIGGSFDPTYGDPTSGDAPPTPGAAVVDLTADRRRALHWGGEMVGAEGSEPPTPS